MICSVLLSILCGSFVIPYLEGNWTEYKTYDKFWISHVDFDI